MSEAPDRLASPAGRLWWMYVLVLAGLAGIGLGDGQIGYLLRHISSAVGVANCESNLGLSPFRMVILGPSPLRDAYAACFRSFNHGQAFASLIGAAIVPLIAWLFMLGSGLLLRRRLALQPQLPDSSAVRAAKDRFEHWCDIAVLSGRRRPRLVLAAPGRLTAQAFTAALPFGRPIVLVPAAYAFTEQAEFDFVVLHELAHVQARDVTWASATWWAAWLNVPVLVVIFIPLVHRFALLPPGYGSSLWRAVIVSLLVLVARTAVLRRREELADRYAVTVLDRPDLLAPDLLVPTAGRLPSRPTGLLGQTRRLARRSLSEHPAAEVRGRRATSRDDGWESGFLLATATGLVAMTTFQSLAAVLYQLVGVASDSITYAPDVAMAVASIVWALVLVPAWARSARPILGSGRNATRWAPLVGSTVGLTAEYLVAPSPVANVNPFGGHLFAAMPWVAVTALGVSVLAAALADLSRPQRVSARRRRAAMTVALLGASAACCAGLSTVRVLLVPSVEYHHAADVRVTLTANGGTGWAAWASAGFAASLLLVPALAATWSRQGLPSRFGVRLTTTTTAVVLAAAVAASAVITCITTQRHIARRSDPASRLSDSISFLLFERWWLCGLAGASTALALMLLRPRTRYGTAVLAGVVVTLLSGWIQFVQDVLLDDSVDYANDLRGFVFYPLWLLFVTLVVAGPAVLAARSVLTHSMVIRSALARAVAGPLATRPLLVALPTTAVVAAIGFSVVSGLAAPVTIEHHDHSAFLADHGKPPPPTAFAHVVPAQTSRPVAGGAERPRPETTLDPGRPLTTAQVTRILQRTRKALPADWTTASPGSPTPPPDVRPAGCGRILAALDAPVRRTCSPADWTSVPVFLATDYHLAARAPVWH